MINENEMTCKWTRTQMNLYGRVICEDWNQIFLLRSIGMCWSFNLFTVGLYWGASRPYKSLIKNSSTWTYQVKSHECKRDKKK